ncbi:HP1 [Haemophilus influenzae]|nr:HP1 [Haemophilus influenzae]CWX40823.1 HP1 [Haemophilus influenzae]
MVKNMMLFNIETSMFAPDYLVTDNQNWIEVSDEEIDGISASITGGGAVWAENGKIKCSGKAPSFNMATKSFELSEEKQTALLAETQTRLIANIDEHAAKIYSTWTRFESEYRERQAAAEAFKAANYEGDCSRYISDFAQRARLDNKTAANLILTQAAGLEKLQVELANQRMRKYEVKAPNLTLEQLQSIHDDIIKQMDNLMEAYQNG